VGWVTGKPPGRGKSQGGFKTGRGREWTWSDGKKKGVGRHGRSKRGKGTKLSSKQKVREVHKGYVKGVHKVAPNWERRERKKWKGRAGSEK